MKLANEGTASDLAYMLQGLMRAGQCARGTALVVKNGFDGTNQIFEIAEDLTTVLLDKIEELERLSKTGHVHGPCKAA